MSAYIKGLKSAGTATAAPTFDLINVDGVNKVSFSGSAGSSHVLVLHYDGLLVDTAGTGYVAPSLNIALPDTNTSSTTVIRNAFADAMKAAVQAPGSIPDLFPAQPNGEFGVNQIITSATSSFEAVT